MEVCLDWDLPADPLLNSDFTVDFTTDPAQPNVELIEGNLVWRLWALDPADPDGTGSLGDIEAFGAEDYGLVILRPDNDTPGVRDVKSIVLTPQSGHFSRILAAGPALSRIRGDVAGDVTVVKSGSDGGTIGLDILGDLAGHLDAPDAAIVFIGGNVTSTGEITIYDLKNSALQINYDVGLAGYVDGPITVTLFYGTLFGFSFIDIEGDLNGDLTLLNMSNDAELTIGGDCSGTITINSGLPCNSSPLDETSFITIGGELTATGTIDLTCHILEGTITVARAGAGDIVGIDVVVENPGQASITLGTVATDVFSGNLSVTAGLVGAIGGLVQIQNLSGKVETVQLGGTLDILGDFTSTGTIDIYNLATSGELKINSAERIGANAAGVINISPAPLNNPFDGSITVFDSTSSTDGDLSRTITVFGTGGMSSTGSIDIQGDLTGTIDVTGDLDGSIVVGDRLRGDIIARDNYAGSIDVAGYMSGDIRVAGDMSSTASIGVDGELASLGRILVGGECDGDIIIGEQTAALSLIRLEGFGSNGRIVINDGEGDFDAEGDIFVGQIALWAPSPPLPDVTFDGSILIKGEAAPGTGGGGLKGRVRVFGCHATADDLDVCQCGILIYNNVTIRQDECENQVDWSCVSGCP